jgi:hypothetical protein
MVAMSTATLAPPGSETDVVARLWLEAGIAMGWTRHRDIPTHLNGSAHTPTRDGLAPLERDDRVEELWEGVVSVDFWWRGHWRRGNTRTPWPTGALQRVVDTPDGDYRLFDPTPSLEVLQLVIEEDQDSTRPARSKVSGHRAFPDENNRIEEKSPERTESGEPLPAYFPPTDEKYRAGYEPETFGRPTQKPSNPVPKLEQLTGMAIAEVRALRSGGRPSKATQAARERLDDALVTLLKTHSGKVLGDAIGVDASRVYRRAKARGWRSPSRRYEVKRTFGKPELRQSRSLQEVLQRERATVEWLKTYGTEPEHCESDWAPSNKPAWEGKPPAHSEVLQRAKQAARPDDRQAEDDEDIPLVARYSYKGQKCSSEAELQRLRAAEKRAIR